MFFKNLINKYNKKKLIDKNNIFCFLLKICLINISNFIKFLILHNHLIIIGKSSNKR